MEVPERDWWRTVVVLIPAISLYTIVLGTVSILSTLWDRTGDTAHGCAQAWSRWILKTTGVRVGVRGFERLSPGRSYIFAANHQSIYDIPIVFAHLPLQLRIPAKASLRRFPFLGWHLSRTGHLLVQRENPGAGILKKMARLIGHGHSLIVFPEGTRSIDGAVGRFKGGMFLLAIESALPVVPVTVRGSRHVMQKGELTVRRGEVDLIVHDPIPTDSLTRADARELAERVRAVVAGEGAERPPDTNVRGAEVADAERAEGA